MNASQRELVERTRSRFGPKSVITDRDELAPWLTDWRGRYQGEAYAILAPVSAAEVSMIVANAVTLGVPLVPQGGNTSMVGGATPPPDGSALILSLRRMNAIRTISPDSNEAVVDAGLILEHFHEAVDQHGRRFPLTLGAKGSATIGGLVSTNAGGTQVLRFGTMRNLVKGLEAVLPNGEIHNGLAALKKDNRGYDLNQLLIGSEGTLGVVTAATLQLFPAVKARSVAWVGVRDPHAALDLLRLCEAETSSIESFEIIPADSLALVFTHINGTRPPLSTEHRWHLLLEATASRDGDESPELLLERLLALAFEQGLVDDAVIAASEGQAEAFWRLRHSLSEAERASGPAAQHDISVPVALMPRFMVDASEAMERQFPGTRASAFGHLGDGNVHFHVRAPAGASREVWYAETAPAVSAMVHDLVVAAGGSISAEHGIGQMKRDELRRLGPAARLSALAAIKRALDPQALFNPGKLIALD